MSDTTFRLIYRSRTLIPAENRKAVLGELFSVARSDNERHEDVTVVDARHLESRTFGTWSMAQVSGDGGADIPLLMNRDRGGISRTAPDPTTADQDLVPDYMHDVAQR